MKLVLRVLEQRPDFAPAIKLKGMLLEEAGRTSEAAAVYDEALKLAPNDGDLLLKAGIYKLAAGQKEEAIRLLQHCIRVLPGDADAQYYLSQAYHLNGQDDLALRAIRQSLKAEPDNLSVWQKYGELLCGTGDCAGGCGGCSRHSARMLRCRGLIMTLLRPITKLMDLAGAAQYAARAVQSQPNDVTTCNCWLSRIQSSPNGKRPGMRLNASSHSKPTMWTRCWGLGNANWN